MRLGILSLNPNLYSTRRLVEAGQALGHEVEVIDYLRCSMSMAPANPSVIYKGKPLELDAVIPRIGASKTFYGTAVVRQFEMTGAFPVNSSQGIARSRDKLRCMQLLSRRDIGMPVTGFAHSAKDVKRVISLIGGAPVVVKLLEGTQGIGVVLCESQKAAESVVDAFRGMNANILIQEFIAEAKGADIRAFVIGDRVVAAMKRQGPEGEFRSNLHRGGHAESVRLTPRERATAVKAAKAMGLRVSGVDMLQSDRGPLVMEVNSSPGLEGVERASGVDVATSMIRFIEENAGPGKRDWIKA